MRNLAIKTSVIIFILLLTGAPRCNSRLTRTEPFNRVNEAIVVVNGTGKVSQGISFSLLKARKDILRGGLSGFAAGLVQVLTLMWLRTTVNYQYRFGKPLLISIRELYAQGGFLRYRIIKYRIHLINFRYLTT